MEFNFPDDRWLIETQEISQQVLRTRSNFHCLQKKDWSLLEQIRLVLYKFNELILFHKINHKNERVAVPIYYEFYDLFDEVTERKDDFENIDENIITAVKQGIKKQKYEKYHRCLQYILYRSWIHKWKKCFSCSIPIT